MVMSKARPISETFLPLIKELKIVDKDANLVRIGDVILPAQEKVVEKVVEAILLDKPCRLIILKARQIGISTIIEAIQFQLAMMFKRFKAMVMSHDLDSSKNILGMTQNYYDTFWLKDAYTQKNKSANTLSWLETGATIRVATAGNEKSGRSYTLRFLHASEVAFWDNAKVLMTGLMQAVPLRARTFIFLESTANGIGNYFHETWKKACNGEGGFTPLFFPWWTHPEYIGSFVGLDPIQSKYLDEEERNLIRLWTNPPLERWNDYTQPPLTPSEMIDRLTWRRYAISDLCQGDLDKFKQEYPSTPEEAFIATGKNIFPLNSILPCYQPAHGLRGFLVRESTKIRLQPNIEGTVKIFKKPTPGQEYLVAGDPTHATEGDYAVAQILNRRTWEQVAIYRAKVDGNTFGEECVKLGYFYNTALLAIEHQGGGLASITAAQRLNYPRIWAHSKGEKIQGQIDNWYGWQTNWKTKNEAISNLKKVLVDKLIIFHDNTTFEELQNYISLPGNQFGNSNEEEHDDCVMSLAIGITVVLSEQDELFGTQLSEPNALPTIDLTPKRKQLGFPVSDPSSLPDLTQDVSTAVAQIQRDYEVDIESAPWERWGEVEWQEVEQLVMEGE